MLYKGGKFQEGEIKLKRVDSSILSKSTQGSAKALKVENLVHD